MSDPLDLEKMESDWLYEGPERAYSRAAFPILVAEVRRLRALLTALDPLCQAEGCQVALNDVFDADLGIWRTDRR